MGYSRSSPMRNNDRSKRQERVGHVVRTEIASIIQLGYQVKNSQGYIDDELRRRISIVSADVSPDLRQARITVSVIKPSRGRIMEEDDEYDDDEDEDYVEPKRVFPENRGSGDAVVDRRRAYSWLVKNTKQIRHALSQRLSHMKTIPNLTFVQADVGAAVDVMNLIEKVSQGDYKRESLGVFGADDDNLPEGMYLESELEGDGWIDDDDDDFEWEDEDEGDEPVDKKK
jgi:ribosome-binding factor A